METAGNITISDFHELLNSLSKLGCGVPESSEKVQELYNKLSKQGALELFTKRGYEIIISGFKKDSVGAILEYELLRLSFQQNGIVTTGLGSIQLNRSNSFSDTLITLQRSMGEGKSLMGFLLSKNKSPEDYGKYLELLLKICDIDPKLAVKLICSLTYKDANGIASYLKDPSSSVYKFCSDLIVHGEKQSAKPDNNGVLNEFAKALKAFPDQQKLVEYFSLIDRHQRTQDIEMFKEAGIDTSPFLDAISEIENEFSEGSLQINKISTFKTNSFRDLLERGSRTVVPTR